METILLIAHVFFAAGAIGLILLQQGKGAEAGASFGSGASQTVFGSQGTASFLSRSTAVLATMFFLTSLGLAIIARQKVDISDFIDIPSTVVEKTVSGDAPISVEKNTVEPTTPVIESGPVEDEAGSETLKESD
ncbi:MAG: preprotein translocase subunit SecG [Candidatus Endonucleobacter bathymodioli]|uniref:Protein-export membrane protein SecG n=1 Tax=Candidatus Endonucleibacter bathymodioli TaxID=539814 RepID=A0AA90NJP3_9GAMM|nr:preprotein translocase subunit SecG [Candidatus Endonucleobacter bathymodioli]